MDDWQPTMRLRERETWVGDHPVVRVEQLFRHMHSGETEWRALPRVEAE